LDYRFARLGAATSTGAKLDLWRLCNVLTVHQAAMLLVGANPSGSSVEDERPDGYEAAKSAISQAVRSRAIDGHLSTDMGEVNVDESQLSVESLRTWLKGCGISTGFFFPEATVAQDYLDPKNVRYAPKLAAAVYAWLATGSEEATVGKSPKKALTKWLREHASEFGLADDEGKPNEGGIEEVAKVANWKPLGGAPKTPRS
jgi:hypothetical protein